MSLAVEAPSQSAADQLVPLPDVSALAGRWWVAHTRSRNEKALAYELGRLAIVNYLPLAHRVTRSPVTRRQSRSLVPVFPGYIFFHGRPEQRYLALRTNRVARVLEVVDQARFVTELEQLHALLIRTDEFEVSQRLRAGDWVRVIAGPLRGVEGVVTRGSHRYRLHINVTILGQSVHVEVDRDAVEKTDPPTAYG